MQKTIKAQISGSLLAQYTYFYDIITAHNGGAICDSQSAGTFIEHCIFEKVETAVKKPWTKWYLNEIRFTDINGKDVRCDYLYRTNGKKVQIRCGAFKAEATCCKDDEFEIEKGLNLAKKRLVIKWLDNQVKSIAKAM